MKRTGGAVDWATVARRLAAMFPRERLHPAVQAWSEVSPRRAVWAVAFSGGADSLALLLLVWAHWPERRRHLRALHFNHLLRGRASDGDEKFCSVVCAALGVRLVSGDWGEARRGASEAEARAARMEFFGKWSRALWLGHQQDDIAETMLMRLARGSGGAGLAAPRPVQSRPGSRVHLRPLLTLKKSELTAGLRKVGAEWREDASNEKPDFFRNRVRSAVIPAWIRSAGRDALAGAALSRELIEEDEAALEARVDELWTLTKRGSLVLASLAGQPRAIVRRALHRWLLEQAQAGSLVRQGFADLLAAVEKGDPTRRSLGVRGFAVIGDGKLRFEKSKPASMRRK
jgi:tRNA(Ile)-lysidine synthase